MALIFSHMALISSIDFFLFFFLQKAFFLVRSKKGQNLNKDIWQPNDNDISLPF